MIPADDPRVGRCLQACGFGSLHVERAVVGCKWPDRSVPARLVEAYTHGMCVLITGGTGRGKTQLAACLAAYVVRSTLFAARVRRVAFTEWVRSLIDRKDKAWYPGVDLLVVDELHHTTAGAGENREPGRSHTLYERGRLFELIENRYEQQLATVLITNLDAGQLERALDQPVLDRIGECGEVIDVSAWPNQRGRKP